MTDSKNIVEMAKIMLCGGGLTLSMCRELVAEIIKLHKQVKHIKQIENNADYHADVNDRLEAEVIRLQEQIKELESTLKQLSGIVDSQAKDDGLWGGAATAPEAYLQQELRILHAAIEDMK